MFLTSVAILGSIGLVFGIILAVAAKKFHVQVDPKEEALMEALPNTNCGACSYPGCAGFAKGVLSGEAETTGCTAGGSEVALKVSAIMGVEVEIHEDEIAVIMCKGGKKEARSKFEYEGIFDCKAAVLVSGGPKTCSYGCLGMGTCEVVCPHDAIYMNDNGLPVVVDDKCTGCRICAQECPVDVIKMLPISQKIHVRCNSLDKGNITRKACDVGCITCKKCVKVCPEDAITIVDNLAIIDPAKCTNCKECVPVCPTDTIENYFPGEPLCASDYKALEKEEAKEGAEAS